MLKSADEIGNVNLVNKSATKAIKNKLLDSSPIMDDIIEDIIPKKAQLSSSKIRSGETRFELFCVNKEILFFQKDHDDVVFPHLRLLHKYPDFLPRMQIDKGGIKFIIKGANVMCPGLTSAGGKIDDKAEVGMPVAIYCEGKEHALAVGKLTMSPEDIKSKNSGSCIETYHTLNDGLWGLTDITKKK